MTCISASSIFRIIAVWSSTFNSMKLVISPLKLRDILTELLSLGL